LRILFSFARGRGHVLPLIPIVRAAADAGHATGLVGAREAVLERDEFDVLFPRTVPLPSSTRGTGVLAPLDPARVLTSVGPLFLGPRAVDAANDVRDVLRQWAADVLVCDELDFGAMVAAEQVGVPCVVVTVFATASQVWRSSIREAVSDLRQAAGLAPDPEFRSLGGSLTVIPVPASMRTGAEFGSSVIRMRPGIPAVKQRHEAADWLHRAVDKPHVYVTLGTDFNTRSGSLFDRLFDALVGVDAQILITSGPHVPRSVISRGRTPSNIRVESFVPQQDLRGNLDLVVCHGGSGSVVGAVTDGVPVITTPLGADQYPNGRWLERSGAGLLLDAACCTVAEVRSSIALVLSNARFRTAACDIKTQFAELPPPDQVLRTIVMLAK